MGERQWMEGDLLIRETVGDHVPQTPLLRKEFGDGCDGVSRGYETRVRFDCDPFLVYSAMREHWLRVVPEDYRTVWEGYVCEPDYLNGSPVQVGYRVKGWFFCYRVPMDVLLKAKRSQ